MRGISVILKGEDLFKITLVSGHFFGGRFFYRGLKTKHSKVCQKAITIVTINTVDTIADSYATVI